MVTSAAGKTERADAPSSCSGDETPSESLARGSDGDASPINNEGTFKSWAKGTRSHTRYGSVSGAPGTNGRSVKTAYRIQHTASRQIERQLRGFLGQQRGFMAFE